MKSPFDQLLQQPEGKTLEFKRDLSSPRNVLRTLVAFANASGGHLVIGVDEDRPVGPESGLAAKIVQYLGTQMTAGKAELAKALGHFGLGRTAQANPNTAGCWNHRITIQKLPANRVQRYRLNAAGLPLTYSICKAF